MTKTTETVTMLVLGWECKSIRSQEWWYRDSLSWMRHNIKRLEWLSLLEYIIVVPK